MSELKSPMSAFIEMDEIELSKKYPDTFFVTLIHNGTTCTIPVQNLIALLVDMNEEAKANTVENQDEPDLIIH